MRDLSKYKNNPNRRIMNASKEAICERICTTYIETRRTVRSLAALYGCSKSTIHRYLHNYAQDCVSYDLYRSVQTVARDNTEEAWFQGESSNRWSDKVGSYD